MKLKLLMYCKCEYRRSRKNAGEIYCFNCRKHRYALIVNSEMIRYEIKTKTSL